MDSTYDLGVFEAENGKFDWLVDYIMEDIIANEKHSIEELKKMKEINIKIKLILVETRNNPKKTTALFNATINIYPPIFNLNIIIA